jgi:hypothetical protein
MVFAGLIIGIENGGLQIDFLLFSMLHATKIKKNKLKRVLTLFSPSENKIGSKSMPRANRSRDCVRIVYDGWGCHDLQRV